MRYYIIVGVIVGIIICAIWILFGSFTVALLKSTDPYAERILLIILIVVTAIVGIIPLIVYFLGSKKIPILQYDIITKTDSPDHPIYFLRVECNEGNGMAETCQGWLTLGNSHTHTVWADGSDICDIPTGLHMDLRLFAIKFGDGKVPANQISLKLQKFLSLP